MGVMYCDECCTHKTLPKIWTIFNPLDAMGICLNKQILIYKVLASSIVTHIHGLMKALDTFVSVAG